MSHGEAVEKRLKRSGNDGIVVFFWIVALSAAKTVLINNRCDVRVAGERSAGNGTAQAAGATRRSRFQTANSDAGTRRAQKGCFLLSANSTTTFDYLNHGYDVSQ